MGRNPATLPPGFATIRDILNGTIAANGFTSVIGIVKDLRAPVPTNGTDYKSAVTLFDKSIEDDGDGLVAHIFRPMADMPSPDVGDCVLLYQAKVQDRGGISLLTHFKTVIHVYSSSQIPEPPKPASVAMQPPCRMGIRLPTEQEHEYVSWIYHNTSKSALPDAADFRIQVEQSVNRREKFSVLGNVEEARFYDIIVQVVKEPFDELDKMNLWVSDYTENDCFYKYSWDGPDTADGRDGDPYGYTTSKMNATSSWKGPFGKRSMQIACWGPHADFIRSSPVREGDWLRLRNIRVKFGHNGLHLEGALHEDRGIGGNRLQVEPLDTTDFDNIDERLKEAIRRKRDYEKQKKKQQKSYTANESTAAGTKRKSEEGEPPRQNAKQRRAQKRAAAIAHEEELQRKKRTEAVQGLNDHIKSESQDKPTTPISSILQRIYWTTRMANGEEAIIDVPFTCARYRTMARVVDYRPRKLDNFTSWRKNTEYDMLSDNSDDSGSESSGDEGAGTLQAYRGSKTWDWHFALQLEEYDPKRTTAKGDGSSPETLWAVVENTEAQLLLGLDACDLRGDQDTLTALRERLFVLWGDLEERKLEEIRQQRQHSNLLKRSAAAAGRGMAVAAGAFAPPPDSSPQGGGEDGANAKGHDNDNENNNQAVSNKPFACCIQQYGVRLQEQDPKKANAGEGYRWERMYGLFGTKISWGGGEE